MSKDGRKAATRWELSRLIDDRRSDPPTPTHDFPRPSWMLDPEDETRAHMRMRERRIRYLQNRLDGAAIKMEQDFDQSS